MKDFLSILNDEQKEAATTTEGHIRVLAGAGTGKTRALTSRYCYLVRDLGISP
ncbi:MAG: UvrD-helicase domain-containing protein, partial [Treponema sp.]|nr:UvrD-helicase domain-containing protein [Treponema sp.]